MNDNYCPLISVVIPVFNVKDYVKESINSVIRQTYRNLEIIIVDDGSTDGSGVICDEYKEKFDNLIVLHKENGGLSDARNYGLEIATGEYISFLDSDDYISPFFYEIVVRVINETGVELIALEQPVMFWDNETTEVTLAKNADDYSVIVESNTNSLLQMFYLKIVTGAQFKILKRYKMEGIRFPKGYVYEDLATTYKEFLHVEKVAVLTGRLYAYRKRDGSIIRQGFSESKLGIIDISRWVVDDIDHCFPDLSVAVRYRVFSPVFSVFLQVPLREKKTRKKLWKRVIENRRAVFLSIKYARKKDILAALISFFGMNISYFLGNAFGRRGTIKKK